eukprot:CAMPEP_0114289966 /NCGR_PEP_ID=MMETSP0059-20121206/7668_1 /TAXON_ID=36894 /ORGANISM="Pyramimonas parkeae, Strain CCMP726" /LENGTH=549 /DNA_ID=CAMNT_0001411299 /DNA_START=77 /DNA_END=1726 /DNA_ORIENTATION=+
MHQTAVVWAQELAVGLIKDQFGDVVGGVASQLVYSGPHTFIQLLRASSLAPPLLKQALLVLLQHNCVAAYKEEIKEADTNRVAAPASVMYAALLPAVLRRLRHPRFMVHIREEFGEKHEIVIQGLLEHGRLRMDQLIEYAAPRMNDTPEQAQGAVEEALAELVSEHFVERAPPPDRAPTASELGTVAGASKPPPRSGPAAATYQAQQAQAMASQARQAQERFRLPPRLQSLVALAAKRKRGEEVAGDVHREAAAVLGAGLDQDTLWRVNPEEFNRRFRHQLVQTLIAEKVEAAAGAVAGALLRVARRHERSPLEERTVPVTHVELAQAMAAQAREGLPAVAEESLPGVLELLFMDPSELVSKVGESPDGRPTVCVNLKRVMDLLRLKQLEAAVRQRFGVSACRVFRLLTMKRQLEQKQIAELAMLPVKETREILYRLLKAGYLLLQEVARSADHNPQRTLYLWRADIGRAVGRLGAELVRTVLLARARLHHELASHAPLLALLESGPSRGRVVLTQTQRAQLEHVRCTAAVLETRLLQLDDLIFLLHDA